MKKTLFILLLFFVGFVFIGCKKTSDNKPDEGNIEDLEELYKCHVILYP